MRYLRFLINFLKILFKRIFTDCYFNGSMFHSLSIHTELKLSKGSKITFGRNIQSDGYCRIFVGHNSNIEIGSGTYFNNGCMVSAMESVKIGSNCLFGPNVMIYDNNHKFSAKKGVSFEHSTASIEIGDNCWIASNVIILKNTKIGSNCVIGAGAKLSGIIPDGSIVTSDVPIIVNKIVDK